jgi:uncharacterized protein
MNMYAVEIEVQPSITRVDANEWNRLEGKRSFYQSYPWLSWAQSRSRDTPTYVLARDSARHLVGAVAAYVLPEISDSWSTWYDPLTVFAGEEPAMRGRRPAWFPLLLIGSQAGYHSDVILDACLDGPQREAVTRALILKCHELAGPLGARSVAMMYSPGRTTEVAYRTGGGATRPIPTSASARISARWKDMDAYLGHFTHRRRYNFRREIETFRSSKSQVLETTLSECCEEAGALLGNLHRKYGADDSDADTMQYLKSQAAVLDGASKVFLEVERGRPVGFSLCYEWGHELHVRVVGFNYDCSARFAYFNLAYYRPLEYAIGRGMDCINLGAGTYAAKVSRGAVLEPSWSVVWPPGDGHRAWFEACREPGQDARDAQPYLDIVR